MKKAILIIISVIVIISSFVACKNNSSSETTATTAVTDEQGTTHYYKAITDKNKKFVTNKSDETITITGYLNEDKSINKVVIPNYINGAKVKRVRGKSGSYSIWNNAICEGKIQLAASAYRPQNLSIKEIIISSGIEKIENTAFLATSNLEKISIPNSVTTLEGWSFGFCYNLKEITISESVTTMGDQVFNKIPSIAIHVPWKEGEKPEGWDDEWNSTGSNCTITVDYAK